MTKPAPQEATITEWLASQKEAMLALLREAVNIDSSSYDKAGVDAVGQRFMRFFQEQGLIATVEPNERFGEYYFALGGRDLVGQCVPSAGDDGRGHESTSAGGRRESGCRGSGLARFHLHAEPEHE